MRTHGRLKSSGSKSSESFSSAEKENYSKLASQLDEVVNKASDAISKGDMETFNQNVGAMDILVAKMDAGKPQPTKQASPFDLMRNK